MIGKIIVAGAIPAGLMVKQKGLKDSQYAEFIRQIATLKVGEGVEITQDEIEASLGKAMPKFFRANMRKRVKETFKGGVEMIELNSGAGTKSVFQFLKRA